MENLKAQSKTQHVDGTGPDSTRREFTAAAISALFVGMSVTVSGCGGGGGGSSSAGPSPTSGTATAATAATGDKAGSISGNHGHAAVVTAAQMQAAGSVSLDIQGGSDHSHTLDLTADQVRQIAAGSRVSKTTPPAGTAGEYGTYGEHDHTVTFN